MFDYNYVDDGYMAFLIFVAIFDAYQVIWMAILFVIGGVLAITALAIGIKSLVTEAHSREATVIAKKASGAEKKLAKE